MDQTVTTGLMSGLPDQLDRVRVVFGRMPGPEISRPGVMIRHNLQQPGRAVTHPFVVAGKGTDIGFHIDSK